jgi:hypothetical protein
MTLRACFILTAGIFVLPAIVSLIGCGGASLDYGQSRNLEAAEANFVDPEWWDLYAHDSDAAMQKYKNKVFQVDLKIEETGEISGGIGVKGSTGDHDSYRITCLFPQTASNRIQGLHPGQRVTVKGLFNRVEEATNTYELWLTSCVLARK